MDMLESIDKKDMEAKVKELEQKLEEAKEYINHTEGAAKVLENLIERGECKQNPDGTVSVVQGPNVVMNRDDVPGL